MNKTIVFYNATIGKWTVTDPEGNVTTYKQGKEGELAAKYLAAATDYPRLRHVFDFSYSKFENNGNYISRLHRALELAHQGYVLEPAEDDHEIARVGSISGPNEYIITFELKPADNLPYKCTCKDWQNAGLQLDNPPGIYCKHILAYMLAKNAGIPPSKFSPNSDQQAEIIWNKAKDDLAGDFGMPPWMESLTPKSLRHGILTMITTPLNIKNFTNVQIRSRIAEAISDASPIPLSLQIQGE